MSTLQETQNNQYIKMTATPIPRLVGTLAVPTIISMLVTNIYNLVDTAFVGSLGTSASGAIGVVFGYMAILQAAGFLFGQGAGSIMSRMLGHKNMEEANGYSSTGFFLSLFCGIIIGIISYLFLTPLIYLLGSTDTIAPYAREYISYIIMAAPFMTSSLTLNNLLRYEGQARLGMVGLMSGALLNICGDAAFIFGLGMGIAGAGLSTAISQFVSFCILLAMFLGGKTQTKIAFGNIFRNIHKIGNIITTGFPSLLRQALGSVSTILLNDRASLYGDAAVAAMSIVSRISFFVMSVAIGIGQGFQPVSSFNYGAGKLGRVRRAFWFTFGLSEALLTVIAVPVFVFAKPLVLLFRDDPQVLFYAVRALRLHCITLLLVPLTMVCEMGFQSTGQKVYATLASSMRNGILFIPTLIILAKLRGMSGIQESQPLTYILSFVVCIFFCKIFLQKMSQPDTDTDDASVSMPHEP